MGSPCALTGTSYAVAMEQGEPEDFAEVIRQATARLRAAEQGDGAGPSVTRATACWPACASAGG